MGNCDQDLGILDNEESTKETISENLLDNISIVDVGNEEENLTFYAD